MSKVLRIVAGLQLYLGIACTFFWAATESDLNLAIGLSIISLAANGLVFLILRALASLLEHAVQIRSENGQIMDCLRQIQACLDGKDVPASDRETEQINEE